MIKKTEKKGIVVFEVGENIETYLSMELQEKINECVADESYKVILDMGKVSFLNSVAIGILVGRLGRLRRVGGDLKLCRLQKSVREIFEMTKLDKVFSFYDSVKEAIDSFKDQ